MEQEIDLRKYVAVALSYKYWIIGTTLLFALLTYGYMLWKPPMYEAKASLTMLQIRSEVAFEPKFKTVSEDDTEARHETLLELARSVVVASQVLTEMSDELESIADSPEGLLKMVTTERSGNLLIVRVTAPDAELAADIVNLWAKEAERYINMVYGQPSEQLAELEEKATQAEGDYFTSQNQLEQFIATNELRALNRQINDLQQIRENLYERHLGILSLGLETQQALAVEERLEFYNTLKTQREQVTNQAVQQPQHLFNYYDKRQQALQQLLLAAQTLRKQITDNASTPTSLGNSLAVLQAQRMLFDLHDDTNNDNSSATLTPFTLSFADPEDLTDDPEQYLADLDALIETVSTEYELSITELTALGEQLSAADNFEYSGIKLDEENPLYQAAMARIEAMMQLDGLDVALPAYSEEPLYTMIRSLDTEIGQLEARLESEQARQKELVSTRDLAWEAYQTIKRKVVEVQVSEEAPASEIRFVIAAVPPEDPVDSGRLLNTLISALVGLTLSLVCVYGWDWWQTVKKMDKQPQQLAMPAR